MPTIPAPAPSPTRQPLLTAVAETHMGFFFVVLGLFLVLTLAIVGALVLDSMVAAGVVLATIPAATATVMAVLARMLDDEEGDAAP